MGRSRFINEGGIREEFEDELTMNYQASDDQPLNAANRLSDNCNKKNVCAQRSGQKRCP